MIAILRTAPLLLALTCCVTGASADSSATQRQISDIQDELPKIEVELSEMNVRAKSWNERSAEANAAADNIANDQSSANQTLAALNQMAARMCVSYSFHGAQIDCDPGPDFDVYEGQFNSILESYLSLRDSIAQRMKSAQKLKAQLEEEASSIKSKRSNLKARRADLLSRLKQLTDQFDKELAKEKRAAAEQAKKEEEERRAEARAAEEEAAAEKAAADERSAAEQATAEEKAAEHQAPDDSEPQRDEGITVWPIGAKLGEPELPVASPNGGGGENKVTSDPNLSPSKSSDSNQIRLDIYGTTRWLTQPGEGVVHAFACISFQLRATIKEDCYGFYPDMGALTQLQLEDGSVIDRKNGIWMEKKTGFKFTVYRFDHNSLILYDKVRDFYWNFPLPRGVTKWRTGPGNWTSYAKLTSTKQSGPVEMIVGGPGIVKREFATAPIRFANVTSEFHVSITEEQRRKILQTMDEFNGESYSLVDQNCIDLVERIAAKIGLQRPRRWIGQLPSDYVRSLAAVNTF